MLVCLLLVRVPSWGACPAHLLKLPLAVASQESGSVCWPYASHPTALVARGLNGDAKSGVSFFSGTLARALWLGSVE